MNTIINRIDGNICEAETVVLAQAQLDLMLHKNEISQQKYDEILHKYRWWDYVPYHRCVAHQRKINKMLDADVYQNMEYQRREPESCPNGEFCPECMACNDEELEDCLEYKMGLDFPEDYELPPERLLVKVVEDEEHLPQQKITFVNKLLVIKNKRKARSQLTRCKQYQESAQEEASLPPIVENVNHSTPIAKWARENRSYDKYNKVPVYGVPILKHIVLSQDEEKIARRIWERVGKGPYHVDYLAKGFRQFGKLLYDLQWYRSEKVLPGFQTGQYFVQTDALNKIRLVMDGYTLQRLNGIRQAPREAKTWCLKVWLKNYKWLLKHLSGKNEDVMTHYLDQYEKHKNSVFMQNGDEETTETFLSGIMRNLKSINLAEGAKASMQKKIDEVVAESAENFIKSEKAGELIDTISKKAMYSMVEEFKQSCLDAFKAKVTTLTGWFKQIKEAVIKFKDAVIDAIYGVCETYLKDIDYKMMLGIVAVILFLVCTWMWWRSDMGQTALTFIVESLLSSCGVKPDSSFYKAWNKANSESDVVMQNFAGFSVVMKIVVKALLGLASLSTMNQAANLIQKMPDVVTRTKDFFVWVIDSLYYLFTGKKHFFPHTEEIDMFKDYMEDLVKFMQIPDIKRLIMLDDALTKRCMRLGKHSLSMQHVLAGMRGLSHSTTNYYLKLLQNIDMMSRDCKIASNLIRNRVEPSVLMLTGEPGHGKSQSMEYFPQVVYDKVRSVYPDRYPLQWNPSMEYQKSKAQIYCDGYDPENHFCWTFEEWLCFADAAKRGEDLSLFLQLVSSKPCVLPFADCSSKNKIGYCSPLICTTSNITDDSLNGVNGMTDINAYYRRRHFLFNVTRDKDVPLDKMHESLDDAWWFEITAERDGKKKTAQKKALDGTGIDYDLLQKKGSLRFRFSEVANLVAGSIIRKLKRRDMMLQNQLNKNYADFGGNPVVSSSSSSDSVDDGAGVGAHFDDYDSIDRARKIVHDDEKVLSLTGQFYHDELVSSFAMGDMEFKFKEKERADDVEELMAEPMFKSSLGHMNFLGNSNVYKELMDKYGKDTLLYAYWLCGLAKYEDGEITITGPYIETQNRSKVLSLARRFHKEIWISRMRIDKELESSWNYDRLSRNGENFRRIYGSLLDKWIAEKDVVRVESDEENSDVSVKLGESDGIKIGTVDTGCVVCDDIANMQNGDDEGEPCDTAYVKEIPLVEKPWYEKAADKIKLQWDIRRRKMLVFQAEIESALEDLPSKTVEQDTWSGRFWRLATRYGLTQSTTDKVGLRDNFHRLPHDLIYDILYHADPVDMEFFFTKYNDKIFLHKEDIDPESFKFFARQFSPDRKVRKQLYNDCLNLAMGKVTSLTLEDLPRSLRSFVDEQTFRAVEEVFGSVSPFLHYWSRFMRSGRVPNCACGPINKDDNVPESTFGSEATTYLKRLRWIALKQDEYAPTEMTPDGKAEKAAFYNMRADCKGDIPSDTLAFMALNARVMLETIWEQISTGAAGIFYAYAPLVGVVVGSSLLYLCVFFGVFFLTRKVIEWSNASQLDAKAKLVKGSLERAAMQSVSRGHVARIRGIKVKLNGQEEEQEVEMELPPYVLKEVDECMEIQYFNKDKYLDADPKEQAQMQNSLADSIDRQISRISGNMRDVAFIYPDGKARGAKTLISGRRMYLNKHFFSCWGRNYQSLQLWNGDAQLFSLAAHEVTYGEDPGKRDLCWIDLPNSVNAFPSLEKYFATRTNFDSLLDQNEVSRIHRLSVGGKVLHRYALGKAASRGITKMYTTKLASGKPYELYMDEHLVTTGLENAEGMCGLPYVTVDGMGVVKILGLHCAAAGSQSVFLPLYYEDGEKSVAYTMQNGTEVFRRGTFVPAVVRETSTKSEQSFDGRLVSLGKLEKGDHIPDKSKIIESVFQGDSEFPPVYEISQAPALLHNTEVNMGTEEEPDLVVRRPLSQGISKMVSPPIRIFPRWIMELFNRDPRRIFSGFFPRHRRRFRMFTLLEALLRLDMSTSIGIDMKVLGFKSRHDLWNKETGWVNPILEKAVKELFLAMDLGFEIKNVVSACLKDETRDWIRVLMGKTRIFCVGSLAHLIVTIMVMGDMVDFIKENRAETDVAIGVNPHGPEWGMFARKLQNHSLFGGGDFSGYDTSITGAFAYGLYKAMLYFSGWTGKEAWYLYNVCMSSVAPYMIINKEVYWMDWMNSSGGWLTGFLNSFVNVVIFNSFFFFITNEYDLGDLDRREEISCLFYGDDNLWSVSKTLAPYFNMQTLADYIWESFGMKYTTPSKDEITDLFLNFDDLEFLCRKFVKTGNLYHAPLAEESIHNMLLWIKKPSDKTVEDQLAVNVEQAMMEFYHYGREKFEKERTHIMRYCDRYSIAYNALSYDEYHERWAHGILGHY